MSRGMVRGLAPLLLALAGILLAFLILVYGAWLWIGTPALWIAAGLLLWWTIGVALKAYIEMRKVAR